MNKWIVLLFAMVVGCSPVLEPSITPPRPLLVARTWPPDPVDHGIFADVDAGRNAIWLEWYSDITKQTTGYVIYRSSDDTVDGDGLLKNRIELRTLEPSNPLFESLDTSYRDTTNVEIGKAYWYQIRPYNRAASNRLTFGSASAVSDSAKFRLTSRLIPNSPVDQFKVGPGGLSFSWGDPMGGGVFQIVVEEADGRKVVWSSESFNINDQSTISEMYNFDGRGEALRLAVQYRWRVKKIGLYMGSTSEWQPFMLK